MRDFAFIWLFFNTKFGRFVLFVIAGYIVIRIASWWLVPIIAVLIAAVLFYDYYHRPKKSKKAKAVAKKELITAICLSAFASLFAMGIMYYKYLEQQEYEKFYNEYRLRMTKEANTRTYEPDTIVKKEAEPSIPNSSGSRSGSYSSKQHYDNMRGFDPASEDDMDDNGMSRYMENYDEEGWD